MNLISLAKYLSSQMTCHRFRDAIGISFYILSKVVIYPRHLGGNGIAFARMVQLNGAVGVIVKEHEQFLHGRMLGISIRITVPFVVVKQEVMDSLISFSNLDIIALEVTRISSEGILRLFISILASFLIINI